MKRRTIIGAAIAIAATTSVIKPASAAAPAPALGGKCTPAQWGQFVAGYVCAKTRPNYIWVLLPLSLGNTPTPSTTAKPANPKPTADSIPAGQWIVGNEIQPGTYRTTGPDCYYKRMSGFSGSYEDIIANGHTAVNGGIIIIESTDKAFESECAWSRIG
jgi:hypothetical protein